MAKETHYFVVFEPDKSGAYNVSFPDFPGCLAFGWTFEEAKRKAREVLELWLEELADFARLGDGGATPFFIIRS